MTSLSAVVCCGVLPPSAKTKGLLFGAKHTSSREFQVSHQAECKTMGTTTLLYHRHSAINECGRATALQKELGPKLDHCKSQWALPGFIRELQIPVGTAGLQSRAPDLSGHCRLQIPVGTAGLQSRLPDPSGHCRPSSASPRSQWALPDFNRELQIPVGTAGLQPRAPDPSGHCRTSTAR
eukprot:s1274_g8.t1